MENYSEKVGVEIESVQHETGKLHLFKKKKLRIKYWAFKDYHYDNARIELT